MTRGTAEGQSRETMRGRSRGAECGDSAISVRRHTVSLH